MTKMRYKLSFFFNAGIILIPALFLLVACVIKRNEKKTNTIRLFVSFDYFMPEDNKLITMLDSVDIYRKPDYFMYVTHWQHDSSRIDKEGNSYFLGSKVKLAGLIAKDDDNIGRWFNQIPETKSNLARVDSFLNMRTSKNFPFYSKENDLLINKTTKNGVLIETHLYKNKKNDSYFDTIRYYFNSNLNNTPYSFSNYLDSTRNCKLSKAEFIYSARRADSKNHAVPRRVFLFELKPIAEDSTQKSVDLFFKKFIVNRNKK